MKAALPIPAAGSVVTVGSFDGVHRGHLAVLEEICARAAATGRASVLVTFEPHPMEVVNPAAAPLLITTGVERREILAQTGLDYAAILRFDAALRSMPPESFVADILLRRFGMRELVIGEDHGFGRGRSGDVAMLREMGTRAGFTVDVVLPVRDAVAGVVSSTRLRQAIAEGDLPLARRMLGRPFTLTAPVVAGAQRGRSIGVPTINLAAPARKLLPPDGVYAVRVEWAGGVVGGMLNQGPRPTVGDGQRTLEAHLFGFDGSLYGSWVRLEWVARLRDIRRFESLDALRLQLATDAAAAKAVLDSRRSGNRPGHQGRTDTD
jgi:riboflavin kinase/FMN adenylyltransferase